MTKRYGCAMLVTEAVRDAIGDDLPARAVDVIVLPGRERPVAIDALA